MGVDLTLAFSPWRCDADSPLLYCRFPLAGRDYDLWGRIQTKALPSAHQVEWYEEEGLGRTTTDKYGDALTWLPAGVLGTILPAVEEGDWGQQDRAFFALIRALPADKAIYLYWH